MYLAREIIKKRTHYYIRDTYQDGTQLKSRDVFDLGTDPSEYILYPGGNGYYNAFRNCHRDYRPPEKVRINMAEAASLFETPWPALKKMDVKSFMRLYRKQTLKHHPDQGGDQERFIRLTKLYEGMLRKKRNR
jgi:hypothetical protein